MLVAVFGVGNPTESIFQLTIADLAVGVTGTVQQPDSAATLEKSFPPALKVGFPLDINILTFMVHRETKYQSTKRTRTIRRRFRISNSLMMVCERDDPSKSQRRLS